jgi:outer membrane protein assembly complex protein YaeT
VTERTPAATPFSQLWLQDYAQALRATNYHRGFPDAAVDAAVARREPSLNQIDVDVESSIRTGPAVNIGSVEFEGNTRTVEAVLHRRVRLDEGGLLDRTQVEEGRQRLLRLGAFESVDLRYVPTNGPRRDVIYSVKEGRQVELSVLAGFGSYELLRGGFEAEMFNIWGRGHQARLRAVQSFRSSSADFNYTMPELVGEDLDVFLNGSGLRREEVDFTREEFGGGLGVHRYFRAVESDISVRYNYQILKARREDFEASIGPPSAAVGAFITDWRHDRRDNPLYPRRGYKIFSTLELASKYVAGDVNYSRLELAGSIHHPIGESRWISLGLSHGLAIPVTTAREDLPFNRRFFPGGDNSVRGFQQGEAAPRNARGQIVGAEMYTSGNLELEQALTKSWSVVGFFDAVTFARKLADFPGDEALFSVGLGLRWRTIIGPVRLEYGHNLHQREHDPNGTLHFSIGFPF